MTSITIDAEYWLARNDECMDLMLTILAKQTGLKELTM